MVLDRLPGWGDEYLASILRNSLTLHLVPQIGEMLAPRQRFELSPNQTLAQRRPRQRMSPRELVQVGAWCAQ